MNLEHLKKVDPEVAEQIELELKRQQETIELIGSCRKRFDKQIR